MNAMNYLTCGNEWYVLNDLIIIYVKSNNLISIYMFLSIKCIESNSLCESQLRFRSFHWCLEKYVVLEEDSNMTEFFFFFYSDWILTRSFHFIFKKINCSRNIGKHFMPLNVSISRKVLSSHGNEIYIRKMTRQSFYVR